MKKLRLFLCILMVVMYLFMLYASYDMFIGASSTDHKSPVMGWKADVGLFLAVLGGAIATYILAFHSILRSLKDWWPKVYEPKKSDDIK